MNFGEIISDNLSKAGWSWGCVSAVDCKGRTIWIVDAHRDNGKRFVVRADEILTASLELESAVRFARRKQLNGAREQNAVSKKSREPIAAFRRCPT
jgi:hypothetical protein